MKLVLRGKKAYAYNVHATQITYNTDTAVHIKNGVYRTRKHDHFIIEDGKIKPIKWEEVCQRVGRWYTW